MTGKDQEQVKVTKSRIPTFKTIEAKAAFWDTHTSEEFAAELTPVEDVKFILYPPLHTHPTSAKPQ